MISHTRRNRYRTVFGWTKRVRAAASSERPLSIYRASVSSKGPLELISGVRHRLTRVVRADSSPARTRSGSRSSALIGRGAPGQATDAAKPARAASVVTRASAIEATTGPITTGPDPNLSVSEWAASVRSEPPPSNTRMPSPLIPTSESGATRRTERLSWAILASVTEASAWPTRARIGPFVVQPLAAAETPPIGVGLGLPTLRRDLPVVDATEKGCPT